MLLGQQLAFALDVIRAHRYPLDMGQDAEEIEQKIKLAKQYSYVVMQIVVTLIVLIGCFFFIYNFPKEEPLTKALTGLIGVVVGYWLR
jgi:hypothetical protein